MFDSHVATLLATAVALVNVLTDGEQRGRPYAAPQSPDLARPVAELLPGRSPDTAPVAEHEAALLARTARTMRRVFEAVDEDRIGDAAGELNALLRETGARPQLDQVPGEPWQLHFHGSDDSIAIGWSAGCATALTLAVGSDLGRLGVCAAPRCDRVYVDNSRNAARQFCSAACQSRVKAAAFRERRASGRR